MTMSGSKMCVSHVNVMVVCLAVYEVGYEVQVG